MTEKKYFDPLFGEVKHNIEASHEATASHISPVSQQPMVPVLVGPKGYKIKAMADIANRIVLPAKD